MNAKRIGKGRKFAILGALYFLVFLALSLFLESSEQVDLFDSSCDTAHAEPTPPFYEQLYPWLTSHSLGRATSERVRIVFIPEDLARVQENLCNGRRYLGDLVSVLTPEQGKSGSSAIVIDKYFSNSVCLASDGEHDDSTNYLKQKVAHAECEGVAVIVGVTTKASPIRTKDDSCLVENTDMLPFESISGRFSSGLLKLNANREQIPLQWKVLEKRPDSEEREGTPQDSLALTTARIVVPDTVNSPRFQSVLHGARQPYARLDLEIPQTSAQNLICSSKDPDVLKRWSCPSYPPGNQPRILDQNGEPFEWAHQIVIVGSQNEVDHWVVLGKRRWGYELQAEYIDALLSGRYLRALPGDWVLYLWTGFLFLLEGFSLLLEFSGFALYELKWVWIWSASFFALTVIGCRHFGYLPPLLMLFGVLLALMTRYIISRRDYYRGILLPKEDHV